MPRTLDEMKLKPNERAALAELKRRLRERFGERLLRFVLFGSRARGEGNEESDLDVLLVIRGYDRVADDDAVHRIAFDIDMRHGVFAQTIEYSETEYQDRMERELPLLASIERDGVSL